MKFTYKTVGTQPADGYRLLIGLHGRGNKDPSIKSNENTKNWKAMQTAFDLPDSCVYLTPCAPEDAPDMWYRPYIVEMLRKLIEASISCSLVNPHRVFFIGYYEGYYSLMELLPLLSEHVAGAVSVAGYPALNQGVMMIIRDFHPHSFVSNFPSYIRNLNMNVVPRYSLAFKSENSFDTWKVTERLKKLFEKMKIAEKLPLANPYSGFTTSYAKVLEGDKEARKIVFTMLNNLLSLFQRDFDPPNLIWHLNTRAKSQHFHYLSLPKPYRDSWEGNGFVILLKSKEQGIRIYCEEISKLIVRFDDSDFPDSEADKTSKEIIISINGVSKTYKNIVSKPNLPDDTMTTFGDPFFIRPMEVVISLNEHFKK